MHNLVHNFITVRITYKQRTAISVWAKLPVHFEQTLCNYRSMLSPKRDLSQSLWLLRSGAPSKPALDFINFIGPLMSQIVEWQSS